jgi:hypothetical protein
MSYLLIFLLFSELHYVHFETEGLCIAAQAAMASPGAPLAGQWSTCVQQSL